MAVNTQELREMLGEYMRISSELATENERLREALIAAQAQITADREGLLLCHATRDGIIPADDQPGREGLAEYDEVLEKIARVLAPPQGESA